MQTIMIVFTVQICYAAFDFTDIKSDRKPIKNSSYQQLGMWRISNSSDSVTFSQIRICWICRPIFYWIWIWFPLWSDSVFSWINTEVYNYSLHVCLHLRCEMAK